MPNRLIQLSQRDALTRLADAVIMMPVREGRDPTDDEWERVEELIRRIRDIPLR